VQVAAIAALEGDKQCVSEIAAQYRSRRDVLAKGLIQSGWPGEIPKASMNIQARITEPCRALDSLEFAKHLLAKAKVRSTGASAFATTAMNTCALH
jgi:alanine-synthesizing transaminase